MAVSRSDWILFLVHDYDLYCISVSNVNEKVAVAPVANVHSVVFQTYLDVRWFAKCLYSQKDLQKVKSISAYLFLLHVWGNLKTYLVSSIAYLLMGSHFFQYFLSKIMNVPKYCRAMTYCDFAPILMPKRLHLDVYLGHSHWRRWPPFVVCFA